MKFLSLLLFSLLFVLTPNISKAGQDRFVYKTVGRASYVFMKRRYDCVLAAEINVSATSISHSYSGNCDGSGGVKQSSRTLIRKGSELYFEGSLVGRFDGQELRYVIRFRDERLPKTISTIIKFDATKMWMDDFISWGNSGNIIRMSGSFEAVSHSFRQENLPVVFIDDGPQRAGIVLSTHVLSVPGERSKIEIVSRSGFSVAFDGLYTSPAFGWFYRSSYEKPDRLVMTVNPWSTVKLTPYPGGEKYLRIVGPSLTKVKR